MGIVNRRMASLHHLSHQEFAGAFCAIIDVVESASDIYSIVSIVSLKPTYTLSLVTDGYCCSSGSFGNTQVLRSSKGNSTQGTDILRLETNTKLDGVLEERRTPITVTVFV